MLDQKKKNKGIAKSHWSKKTRLKYLKMAPLSYAEEGKQVWSVASQNAIKKFPEVEYWAKQGELKAKGKAVGKAKIVAKTTFKGGFKATKESFKEIADVKGILNNKNLKGLGKALGPVGAGLGYYNNYQAAKADGLSGKKAAVTATVDTAIDTAVQGASVAAFSVIIPVPGVGTAAGVAFGLFINNRLNIKSKKTGKTKMDSIKGWFK